MKPGTIRQRKEVMISWAKAFKVAVSQPRNKAFKVVAVSQQKCQKSRNKAFKQKVVIILSSSGNVQKYRSKVFKIAVSLPGVESAAVTGQEKNQLEVEGERIDAVELINMLRKNLGQAEFVSVGALAVAVAVAITKIKKKFRKLLNG